MMWDSLDKTEVRKRVGERVRELRKQHGMTLRQLAEAVTDASHGTLRWTPDTVTNIQAGSGARVVQIEDAIALARVFGCTLDELLLKKPERPVSTGPGRPRVGEYDITAGIGFAAQSQSERLPAWPPAPGQKRRLETQAERAGISRAAMLRVTTAIGLNVVEGMDDGEVRRLTPPQDWQESEPD